MYWNIFLTFFKVGMFTIGGGYAVLPALQKELTKKGWLTDEECLDAISLVNGLPGPLVITGATFMGHKMKGVRGAVAAVVGAALPSIIVILLISSVFSGFMGHAVVRAFFAGVRPAVCALILYSAVRMAQSARLGVWHNAILAAGTLVGVRYLGVPHAAAIAFAAFVGALKGYVKYRGDQEADRESVR